MSGKRKRTETMLIRVSVEEKELIQQARLKTGSKSIADFILNTIENSNVILIKEIESYSDVFAKSGLLGKGIIKGLSLIQNQPERYQAFIEYLEKDNKKNFSALLAFARNLEKATNAYCLFEDNISCSANLTLKDFIKSKRGRK